MQGHDFLQGVRTGLMIAHWFNDNEELLREKEVISLLQYKTKAMFLKELVMCEKPKLKPIMLGKKSRRLYKKSDVYELINRHQFVYDYATAQRNKNSIYQ